MRLHGAHKEGHDMSNAFYDGAELCFFDTIDDDGLPARCEWECTKRLYTSYYDQQ